MGRDRNIDRVIEARRRKRDATLRASDGRFSGFDFSDIGDALGDAASAVGDVVDTGVGDVADVFTSAIDAIPGGRDVRLAIDSVLVGPVRDFANTAVGQVVLIAVASAIPGGLAATLGPGIEGVAFVASMSVPGVLAGDPSFSHAWATEFARRCQQTAEYFGGQAAGDLLNAAFAQLSDYVVKNGVVLTDYTRDTFQALAEKAGVPDLVAAYAVGLARKELPSNWIEWSFDPKTGKATPRFAGSTLATTTTTETEGHLGDVLSNKKDYAKSATVTSVQAFSSPFQSLISPATSAAASAALPIQSAAPPAQAAGPNLPLILGLGFLIVASGIYILKA